MTKPLESDKLNQVTPNDQPKPPESELTDKELDKVSGGAGDLTVTKTTDKSSTN